MRRVLPPARFADVAAGVPAGDSRRDGRAAWLDAGGGDRPDRPEAGAPRRAEPEPRLDARRHRRGAARQATRGAPRCRPPRASHRAAGLKAVTGEHYEGGHWLGSFAVYLTTRTRAETVTRAAEASPHVLRPHCLLRVAACSASHWFMRSPTSHISCWCRSMTGFEVSRSS